MERLPDLPITFSDGQTSTLHALATDQDPIALVFLRHFGCVFCREHVAELRAFPDLPVVFVSMGTPAEAQEFKQKMTSPHPFLSDPQANLYQAAGLRRGGAKELFGPRVWKAGFKSWAKGNRVGRPVGDPFRLSGTFIIGSEGKVLFAHPDEDAGDILRPEAIQAALTKLPRPTPA